MTLTLCWIRTAVDGDELVVASDSRFSGGGHIDICQKIFALPREDACLAFSGQTSVAFPIIHHLIESIRHFPRHRDRSVDITKTRTHLLEIVNQMRSAPQNFVEGEVQRENLDTNLIYAGYSWKEGDFRAYNIFYDKGIKRYSARALSWRREDKYRTGRNVRRVERKIIAIGDVAPKKEFFRRLKEKLGPSQSGLNYEPLQVLSELCRDGKIEKSGESKKFTEIGGVPQMMKVYRSGNRLPFAVRGYVDGTAVVCLFGRPLLSYEKTPYPIINIDTLEVLYPLQDIKN